MNGRQILKQGTITLLFKRHTVVRHIIVTRCTNCQNFGHFKHQCECPTPYCANCGETHNTLDCESNFEQCVNCSRSKRISKDHKATSLFCTYYQEAKQQLLRQYYSSQSSNKGGKKSNSYNSNKNPPSLHSHEYPPLQVRTECKQQKLKSTNLLKQRKARHRTVTEQSQSSTTDEDTDQKQQSTHDRHDSIPRRKEKTAQNRKHMARYSNLYLDNLDPTRSAPSRQTDLRNRVSTYNKQNRKTQRNDQQQMENYQVKSNSHNSEFNSYATEQSYKPNEYIERTVRYISPPPSHLEKHKKNRKIDSDSDFQEAHVNPQLNHQSYNPLSLPRRESKDRSRRDQRDRNTRVFVRSTRQSMGVSPPNRS